jgi:hypothetical protein
MTAIALRESSGGTDAHNPGTVDVPENSYGLWQINVKANPQIMAQLGITAPSQLLDPTVNAQAAYLLWGGIQPTSIRHGLSTARGLRRRAGRLMHPCTRSIYPLLSRLLPIPVIQSLLLSQAPRMFQMFQLT